MSQPKARKCNPACMYYPKDSQSLCGYDKLQVNNEHCRNNFPDLTSPESALSDEPHYAIRLRRQLISRRLSHS